MTREEGGRSSACRDAALADLRGGVAAAIDALRERPPRIHALVPTVSQPLCANVCAALAIDISMSVDPIDVRAMVLRSDATLLNLGMMDNTRREGVKAAIATDCPFVLDPVKVDRAPDRLEFARAILAAKPRIVKGNAAEMALLRPSPYASVLVTTGREDIVACADNTVRLANGDVLMDRVVATGCSTGILVTAMSCVARDAFTAAVAGTALMTVASEVAAKTARGPGSFAVQLLDALAALDGKSVAQRIRFAGTTA